jgi:hypothetical protein
MHRPQSSERTVSKPYSLSTPRRVYLATLGLLVLFVLLWCFRAYPFVDDVNEVSAAGNDWLTYKLNALSILRSGLSMPHITGNYHLPGGFLYNYFVAAIFLVGGENSTHVYLVQAILLALSVGITTLAFRPVLNERAVTIYFLALAVIAFVDVFWFYTFRLLSENLVFFLLAAFYLLLMRAVERKSIFLMSLAGAVFGLCALCRQNLLLLGPIAAVLLFVYLKGTPRRVLLTLSFVFWFCLFFSPLPLRNYAVTGEASIPVVRYTVERFESNPATKSAAAGESPLKKSLTTVAYYSKRIAFCLGITTALNLPAYYLKPHWLLIWFGALVYVGRKLRLGNWAFWEAFAVTFILAYLEPLIAVADISNYGVRMIVPVMPVVLLLAVSVIPRMKAIDDKERPRL